MVCKRSYACLNSSLYRVPDFLVNLFSMKLLKCEVIVCRNQSTNGEIFLNFFKWLRNLSSAISVQTQVISFTQRKKSMKWIWFFKMSFIYARFLDAEYQSYGGIKADALQEVFQYSAFFMQINKRTFLLSANESECGMSSLIMQICFINHVAWVTFCIVQLWNSEGIFSFTVEQWFNRWKIL